MTSLPYLVHATQRSCLDLTNQLVFLPIRIDYSNKKLPESSRRRFSFSFSSNVGGFVIGPDQTATCPISRVARAENSSSIASSR